jgi:hypothetical protein
MVRIRFALALLTLLAAISPVSAQTLSIGQFWSGFRSYWSGMFGNASGVAGIAIITGIIGIFIITRGKWLK